tara:strand:+ start:259 stop:423 length:165 start_codon:yes stop_codon:yes gene_type:complete
VAFSSKPAYLVASYASFVLFSLPLWLALSPHWSEEVEALVEEELVVELMSRRNT